ncbi:hypothetical protein FC678_24650 [Peribacillus simplex]|uniref:Uncharacterized protein n=1 Tax=Peribacillus simplex TaxID=1478 RepID=A0A9X8ZCP2_9BACI|nr:hypothetical protein [Peribacillus simplex]TKH04405.1 hypothetical protein FC678_24650 [Peribacillus simplex]
MMVFDSQQISEGLYPEEVFPDYNFVYRFHQCVNQSDTFFDVYRSLKRISFEEINNTGVRVSRSGNSTINMQELALQQIAKFPDCRDQYFVLSDFDDEQFMRELNEERLFNHEWLSSYIKDYYTIFNID